MAHIIPPNHIPVPLDHRVIFMTHGELVQALLQEASRNKELTESKRLLQANLTYAEDQNEQVAEAFDKVIKQRNQLRISYQQVAGELARKGIAIRKLEVQNFTANASVEHHLKIVSAQADQIDTLNERIGNQAKVLKAKDAVIAGLRNKIVVVVDTLGNPLEDIHEHPGW